MRHRCQSSVLTLATSPDGTQSVIVGFEAKHQSVRKKSKLSGEQSWCHSRFSVRTSFRSHRANIQECAGWVLCKGPLVDTHWHEVRKRTHVDGLTSQRSRVWSGRVKLPEQETLSKPLERGSGAGLTQYSHFAKQLIAAHALLTGRNCSNMCPRGSERPVKACGGFLLGAMMLQGVLFEHIGYHLCRIRMSRARMETIVHSSPVPFSSTNSSMYTHW